MYTYYDYFYKVLEIELRQGKRAGNRATADSFRHLTFEDGKRKVNEIMRELVLMNETIFEKETVYTFDSDVTEWKVPFNVAKLKAYKNSESKWKSFLSMSEYDTIRRISNDTIYNEDGWSKGDALTIMAVYYPDEIVEDYDIVNFPDGYINLLTYYIKRDVYSRVGKSLDNFEFARLKELEAKFKNDIGQVKTRSRIKFVGHRFGRIVR